VLKAQGKQGEGGPDEAERRDDGEVDRGGRGLEREGVMYPSRQSSGYLRPLTLPPPLTTFYGRNKQSQTLVSHHYSLHPSCFRWSSGSDLTFPSNSLWSK
jgi:hypothetical protein